MGLFKKNKTKPKFTIFSEDHFKSGVKPILWEGELIAAEGFFEDGPDPLGEEGFGGSLFGGNSHTYLAVTSWRIIGGYLANGQFSSHEYSKTKPHIRKSGPNFYFTYSDTILTVGGSSTFRSTYSVSKEIADEIEKNINGARPNRPEETQIHLSRKSWGESPLAELAKATSGRDYMHIEICTACNAELLVPDDIEASPEKGNQECRTCLRVKQKN